MSTIKVNKIENTATADGGIAIDATGHVQIDGVQLPTAGAFYRPPLVINGAMNVAQRGTTATISNYGTVDRFQPGFSGGAVTQTQETLTSGSPYDQGFRKFLRLTNTTANTDASGFRRISHQIEAQNVANSGWNYTSTSSYITVSAWVRASVSQTYYLIIYGNDGTFQTYTSAIALTANTWTKITKTIPGNSNLTFNNDNGSGLQVDFQAFFGTNYTDSGFTTDAWADFSGPSRAPDFTNTWANTTNATFDLTGVQIDVGEKSLPFPFMSYGDELARCQRYYFRAVDGARDADHAIMSGGWYITTQFYGTIHFPVEMRTAPTLSYSANSNTSAFRAFGAGVSSSTDDLATQQAGTTIYSIYLYNLGAQTAGQGGWAELNNESGAFIAFAAEL